MLAHEDENSLVAMGRRLRHQLAPVGEMELILVDSVISAAWRLKRILRIEKEMIDHKLSDKEKSRLSFSRKMRTICQINIQRTFNKGRFFATKTKTSNRKIDLGPTVMTELKKWKLACPQNELDLMFPNGAGGPINYSNMGRRHYHPSLEAAGLPRIRFHDLRHTYASLLIDQGENLKYIQTQLGHSSPTVTLNVYAHLMKPTNQEAACRLENSVFGESGSKMVAGIEKGVRPETVTP